MEHFSIAPNLPGFGILSNPKGFTSFVPKELM
jgi:hypothetical protein